jgi:hypothetical protein
MDLIDLCVKSNRFPFMCQLCREAIDGGLNQRFESFQEERRFGQASHRRCSGETPRRCSVPRLSIIIPHQNNDAALENTILSVLENRPEDCEIIVVHDGSYSDPYRLEDELLLIQEPDERPAAQINAGLMVSRSPIVCVLSNGVSVQSENWADAACEQMMRSDDIASLTVPTQPVGSDSRVMGICHQSTRNARSLLLNRMLLIGSGEHPPLGSVAGPTASCGFFRRRVLLALDGWNERVDWSNADIELAFLMDRLGLRCELLPGRATLASTQKADVPGTASVRELAGLAVAYGLCEPGLLTAISDLLQGLRSGHLARSFAWAVGVMNPERTAQVPQRLKSAEQGLARLRQPNEPQLFVGIGSRRAA